MEKADQLREVPAFAVAAERRAGGGDAGSSSGTVAGIAGLCPR